MSFDNKNRVYKVEKKVRYTFNDYSDVISEFNSKLIEFMEELCKICAEKSWRSEIDELGSYIETISCAISMRRILAIMEFSKHIYPLWNFIKCRDEKTLLNQKIDNKDNAMIIFKYKKLWYESGDDNKEYIFEAVDYLCYLIQHYEEVAMSLGHIQILTKVYPIVS